MEVCLWELREAAELLEMKSKRALLTGVDLLSPVTSISLSLAISVTLRIKMIMHGAEISSCFKKFWSQYAPVCVC